MAENGKQATLLRDELKPLPRDWRSYVPVLQNRKGELEALSHVAEAVWASMVPLIALSAHRRELTPPLNAGTVRGWVKTIAQAVQEHPVYLDPLHPQATFEVEVRGRKVPMLEEIYAAARRRKVNFIPVAPFRAGKKHLSMVGDAAAHDGHGLAIRYRFRSQAQTPGMSVAEMLGAALAELGQPAERVDLLLDAEWIDPDVEIATEDVARVLTDALELRWRGLVLLGTCVPQTMSCVPQGTVGSIRRDEWLLWRDLAQAQPTRLPAFGDYVVQHPKRPSSSGQGMRRNIRYTAEHDLIVARGQGDLTESSDEQYRELCQWLRDHDQFERASYSWGDRTIVDCAAGYLTPGSQSMWRGAGASHHMQLVSDQLGRL